MLDVSRPSKDFIRKISLPFSSYVKKTFQQFCFPLQRMKQNNQISHPEVYPIRKFVKFGTLEQPKETVSQPMIHLFGRSNKRN